MTSQTSQLDLFADNRPAIMLNMAHEFIVDGDPDQAISTCEQLLRDYPDNSEAAIVVETLTAWHDLFGGSCGDPERLRNYWQQVDSIAYTPLKQATLIRLADALQAMPNPESVFLPPDFHLGRVQLKLGQYDKARASFLIALTFPGIPQGRFLLWCGETLTFIGSDTDALECYLSAFLDDPSEINTSEITNPAVVKMIQTFDPDDGDVEPGDETAWLAAWGVLKNVFRPVLVPPEQSSTDASGFGVMLGGGIVSLPRLWYDMLLYAESLRTMQRNDQELTAVRRLMKRANGFMFRAYMDRIGV
jgi:tetratricopeptide (TPR) repeat protein